MSVVQALSNRDDCCDFIDVVFCLSAALEKICCDLSMLSVVQALLLRGFAVIYRCCFLFKLCFWVDIVCCSSAAFEKICCDLSTLSVVQALLLRRLLWFYWRCLLFKRCFWVDAVCCSSAAFEKIRCDLSTLSVVQALLLRRLLWFYRRCLLFKCNFYLSLKSLVQIYIIVSLQLLSNNMFKFCIIMITNAFCLNSLLII